MPDNSDHANAVESDLAGFITTALTEVCLGDEDRHPLEPTLARYFHPDYRQWTDGRVVRYPDLVGHMRRLREHVVRGRIEVLQCLREGRQVAARYTVHHVRTDGSDVHGEVYFFGALADDDRFVLVHELSRPVSGID